MYKCKIYERNSWAISCCNLLIMTKPELNGSVSVRASRIRKSEVWIRTLTSSCKYSKKNLPVLWLYYFLLSSWRSPTKRAGYGSGSQRYGSDPFQNVKDPEQCYLPPISERRHLLNETESAVQSQGYLSGAGKCFSTKDWRTPLDVETKSVNSSSRWK